MRLALALCFACLVVATPVAAGPNAGGSLILHANPSLAFTPDTGSWCESSPARLV